MRSALFPLLQYNDPRRVALGIGRIIAETTGRNVEMFDSTRKERIEGKENGRFEPDTNTLYIDVNAGVNEINGVLESAMLPTLSHELVHVFAVENPAEFKKLSDIVFRALTADGKKTRADLIAEEVKHIQETNHARFNGKNKATREAIAEEEIVARACEDRLSNSKLMENFIAEMQAEDSVLAHKFKTALGRAIEKIINAIKYILGQRSYSKEAQKIATAAEDILTELQEQYDKLLMQSEQKAEADTSREAQKNTSDRGAMKMDRNTTVTDQAYMDAINRGDMDTVQRMVDEAAKRAGYTIKAYHGTPIKGITAFDSKKIGSTTDEGLYGRGFYFTTHELTAEGYATEQGEVMPVFLKVKSPWWAVAHRNLQAVAEELGMSERALTYQRSGISKRVVVPIMSQGAQFTSHLIEKGYDSIVIQHGAHNYEIVEFDSSRIKSADPITYDDDGNVIPLSKRFNEENDDIRYQGREHWSPNMNQSEKRYIRSVAKNQANKTDNYLDSITKWLYYEKNGNSYFALYSTDDTEPEPTILYACKGKRAQFECNYLLDYFEKEIKNGKSYDAKSRITGGVFLGNKNASNFGTSDNDLDLGRGRSGRDAETYPKNSRRKPSKALRNCIENLAEIQSRGKSTRLNDKGSMFQERDSYRSAREILTAYAKDAATVKERNGFLGEYMDRVETLDRKKGYLDSAAYDLSVAMDQGRKDSVKNLREKVNRLEREIKTQKNDPCADFSAGVVVKITFFPKPRKVWARS